MIENVLCNRIIEIGRIPLRSGKVSSFDVFHDGKKNHKIFVSFEILNNINSQHMIDFYILTPDQFDEWVVPKGTNSNSNTKPILPKQYHSLLKGQSNLENFEIPINRSTRVYFLVEKGSYTASKISVHVYAKEKYEQERDKPHVYTNFSVTTNSLSKKIKEIINSSTKSLKIISPYTDLHVIEELSSAIDRGVNVMLITRDQKNLEKTHPTRMAFPHLSQLLKKNLKTNDRIHSRLIICDDSSILLMTSDLDQNSMQNLMNCGILVTDTSTVNQISDFFNSVWDNSKNSS